MQVSMARSLVPFAPEYRDFALLERWLGDADMLFLRRDRAEPLVVLPWRVWARLLF
jgi:hypothetical protein